MHTHTHTHVYKRIHIHVHTHMHIHIYIHVRTHTHIHITYTHTYKLYICTHASTSETTARQRLRGKPDLTPKRSALLPVRCNPEGDYTSWRSAQLPVHEERRINAEQPQPTVAHHTITTARRPDHIRLSALVRSRSTHIHSPPKFPAWLCPPETRSFFCHFGGFFLCMCLHMCA